MVLQGVAMQPTYSIAGDATVFSPVSLTVFGYDPAFDGGVRMGGDRIVVCNPANLDDPCGPVLAGPNSPLVVYGDTSQDGVWYGGRPDDIKGMEFGPKPFDPFYKIPDAENEDDEWIFPLANPYDFDGNDVIDASHLFAGITCNATCSNLPTVGFTAYGGGGDDLIIGSQAGDHLAGGSGDDTLLGLRGVDHLYGDSGVNVNILTRGLSVATTNASPRPTLDPRQPAGDQTLKPVPSFNADTLDAGRDLIYGEGAGTVLGGPQSAYDDVIFGDHGAVIQQTTDPNEPDTRLQKIQTTTLASIRLVESRAYDNGDDDVIFGNLGRDVIIAGAGHDMADGDEADDMLFGDNAFLLRRVVEPAFPLVTDYAGPTNTTSGRFQALCGTLLYSRTDRINACGGDPVGQDNSGLLLVNGVWQNYRDPDVGPGDVNGAPWWAEYLVDFDDEVLSHQLHSFDVQLSVVEPANVSARGGGSFGNDYLAGGAAHDLLFGQMGDDTIQGDGGIELAFAATSHVSASRSPDGCTGAAATNLVCDYVGDLDVVPSFEAATDGEDYIEGGGGDDSIFGGLGQDDIVGGSSDFFGLADETLTLVGETLTISGEVGVWRIVAVAGGTLTLAGGELPAVQSTRTLEIVGANKKLVNVSVALGDAGDHETLTITGFNWAALGFVGGRDRRPDGADLVYGGAGVLEDRNADALPLATTALDRHARDADTIAGDNARIVRIVGTGGIDGAGVVAPNKYVTFNYDAYGGTQKLIVRGVHQLDYTPGGPDFVPSAFFLVESPQCNSAGSGAVGQCSTPLATCDGQIDTKTDAADTTAAAYTDIGGRDEVHGESGDDTVYSGCGNDVIFGDGDDDDLIGGWGNDWISGGTGQDGVLGDDGRIFTSRNTGCAGGVNCWLHRALRAALRHLQVPASSTRTRRSSTATC